MELLNTYKFHPEAHLSFVSYYFHPSIIQLCKGEFVYDPQLSRLIFQCRNMSNDTGNANGSVNGRANGDADKHTAIPPSMSVAPSRVTLHLGHLPSKKDIRASWPRTPTRVHASLHSRMCFPLPAFFRLTQTTRPGPRIGVIMNSPSPMRRCPVVFPLYWARRSTTPL